MNNDTLGRGMLRGLGHSLAASTAVGDTGAERLARRALDVLVSGVALVVLSPLMLLVAILVRLDSPGPILFRQVRIGQNRRRASRARAPEQRLHELFGRPFTLYKFRTMYFDAAERFPELYRYSYSPEELRTIPIKILVGKKSDAKGVLGDESRLRASLLGSDPRVTALGRWLRRTSLDELPNLLNVFLGDMHLVGPRPDIASNIAYYRPEELRILDVKPGITGVAQVRGRGLLTFEQTNACDLAYVEERSLALDLRILLQTIPVLLKREGAY
jgi:lipopolysaccharide/colanic/teichoic acid biosynthesis glycosyltransferase